jgi:hypothetical protein
LRGKCWIGKEDSSEEEEEEEERVESLSKSEKAATIVKAQKTGQ